jgi:hypothetical protein
MAKSTLLKLSGSKFVILGGGYLKKGNVKNCPYCNGKNIVEQINIEDINIYGKTVIDCACCNILFIIRDDGDGAYIQQKR